MDSHAPKLPGLDHTVLLAREGYTFIQTRRRRFHSDVFEGRLFGERAVFMAGTDAARRFYDDACFRRADATPLLVKKTLLGVGGVQGLDDDAHAGRKALFMSLMTKARLTAFVELVEAEWRRAALRFERGLDVVLVAEARRVLANAACLWAGIPEDRIRTDQVAEQTAAMVHGFATLGPDMWRARKARLSAEAWAESLVEAVRRGEVLPTNEGALSTFAGALDAAGKPLTARVAAVELLNVIRPIVALANWVAFMALALHDHPRLRSELETGEELLEPFVQEVRRFYPFTPFLGARARQKFAFQGVRFEQGTLAILDVYGNLHDERVWDRPETFEPRRFVGFTPSPFDFIPQGGGSFTAGHRCAGEWLSIETLKSSARFLTHGLRYLLPAQDLSYSLRKIPTLPKSGVVLSQVLPGPSPETAALPNLHDVRGLEEASPAR